MNRVAGEVLAQNNIIRNGRIRDMRIIKTKDYNDMSRKAANYIGALIINKPGSGNRFHTDRHIQKSGSWL